MVEFYVQRWPLVRLKRFIKRLLPKSVSARLRPLWRGFLVLSNSVPNLGFVLTPPEIHGCTYPQRVAIASRLDRVRRWVRCPHSEDQIVRFYNEVLRLPPDLKGCIVEAGCFKGGSSAKFSWLAKRSGRVLRIFDSFEGLPQNKEEHGAGLFGYELDGAFVGGEYRGSLDEVQQNIRKYGCADVCEFHKGWFEETLPDFREPIAAAYIDVDLASSTRTCLKHIYPRLVPGGVLMSQDGHVPLVIEVLEDASFWQQEVGCAPPKIDGLRTDKLVTIRKPATADGPRDS